MKRLLVPPSISQLLIKHGIGTTGGLSHSLKVSLRLSAMLFTDDVINFISAMQRPVDSIFRKDLLFFRESNARLSASKRLTKVLKAAAVAEVYGFPDYAVELLSAAAESNPSGGEMLRLARDMVIQNFQPPQSVRHKVQRRLRRLLGIQQVEFPSLHY